MILLERYFLFIYLEHRTFIYNQSPINNDLTESTIQTNEHTTIFWPVFLHSLAGVSFKYIIFNALTQKIHLSIVDARSLTTREYSKINRCRTDM